MLLDGSPAINAANDNICRPTDQQTSVARSSYKVLKRSL
ncbi:choice-of-anchor Q domain-containing protein [Marinicella sp. W31]